MSCPDQHFYIDIAYSAKVFNVLALLLQAAEFACYITIFWDQAGFSFSAMPKGATKQGYNLLFRIQDRNCNIHFLLQHQYNKTSSKNVALSNMQDMVHRRKRQGGRGSS